MATSTNYGWSEPDNTSLVRDGALAIRTLGNAIDTTMATKAVASNPVINSAMQVWQRGTSVAGSTTAFSADRWQSYRGVAGSTFSRQTTSDTTNLPFIQYCTRVQRDNGNTSTTVMAFFQNFETINSIPYAGKSITFSFYARKGANYSPTSSALGVQLISGTGTDQNVITGYTGSTNVVNQTATLTTTWQRFSYTGTVAATATELCVYFSNTPVGTAGAADYYEVTGVQIDLNSVALPFQTASGNSIQGELAMCQRYYFRTTTGVANQLIGAGIASGVTTASIYVVPPVTMRIAPTSVEAANLSTSDLTAFTNAVTAPTTLGVSTPNNVRIDLAGGSGMTIKTPIVCVTTNTSGYLGLSAEL
jgi:hypothetical protein